VSVIWEGYLQPLYSESYTFYVEANDGVRVIVNGQTVIEYLVDSVTDLDTHLITSKTPITLQAGELVPITVQYYQNTGVGMIALYWLSASQSKQIIPSTAYFNQQSSLPVTGISYMIQAIDVPMASTDLA